jgi:hypothetical protein
VRRGAFSVAVGLNVREVIIGPSNEAASKAPFTVSDGEGRHVIHGYHVCPFSSCPDFAGSGTLHGTRSVFLIC